ncbi:MAG: copper chaperone PCu(A)C [Nitratireductor sp.]
MLGEIAIGHVWAPPPEPGADGLAVYGAFVNRGAAVVRLVAARAEVAERTRIRADVEGAATWPKAITFRPGQPFALAPWREHIWLSGLRYDVQEGESFKLELDFGEAGSVLVDVAVEAATGH